MRRADSCVSGGMTKKTATKVEIAAAVLRSRAPKASAVRAATVRYNAEPMIERSAPGSDSDAFRFLELSTAWPMPNAMKLLASMVANTAPAHTASLAQSIGSRAGTTAREARIIPVLYSPLITRTPRTPMDSWAKKVPVRLVEAAVAPVSRPRAWLTATAQSRAPRPISSATASSSVYWVERSDRNLVHSESATRSLCHAQRRVVADRVVRSGLTAVMPPPARVWTLSELRYSTESLVKVMNAASSEVCSTARA